MKIKHNNKGYSFLLNKQVAITFQGEFDIRIIKGVVVLIAGSLIGIKNKESLCYYNLDNVEKIRVL